MSSDPPSSDNTEPTETTTAASIIAFLSREVLSAAIALAGVYLSAKVIKRVMDPNYEARERSRARREAVLERLFLTGVPRDAMRGLSSSEESLLHELVFPEDIGSDFGSVGGLLGTKETLKELIVYPLLFPDVYRAGEGGGGLLSPPKGVLLYGPPGTGKTMLAKALAKESGANFLALSPSSLLSKWLGDTEQLARAVFSLARRVQPTVIFIDEIDGLFRERTSSEHEVHKNLKAEFMQLWDGLTTDDRYNQVVVLGATNRPYDVDPAILRRMPRPFEVGLPNLQERVEILRKILEEVDVEVAFDYAKVAQVTEGYSGSDLKELCRAAMMTPVRESLRVVAKQRRMHMSTTAGLTQPTSSAVHQPLLLPTNNESKLRPLTLADVLKAREEVKRTQEESASYEARALGEGMPGQSQDRAFPVDMDMFAQMVQALSRAR
eukprot:GFKZ01013172.1.p1 GENE.GFKZ01013172.1~~GFKZ01013172.1.p1  ORF type:complete len:437 (-),score=74.96 GFKZ01013172.1:1357-2667(-)